MWIVSTAAAEKHKDSFPQDHPHWTIFTLLFQKLFWWSNLSLPWWLWKHRCKPPPDQLSWTSAGHLPHADIFSFVVTRDNNKQAELLYMCRILEFCKLFLRVRDQNILWDRYLKVSHRHGASRCTAHNLIRWQIFPSSDHCNALAQTLHIHYGRGNGLNIPALISMIFN